MDGPGLAARPLPRVPRMRGFTAWTASELLERRPQLEALARWWLDATAGDGRLVFVGGEAGIGKTSLVRRFCADPGLRSRLPSRHVRTPATPVPLGPVLDMAGSLPNEFGGALDGADVPVAVRRAFVDEIGRDRAGTVAVVEDAHWADEATIDPLRFLGRRLDAARRWSSPPTGTTMADRGIRSGVLLGDLADPAGCSPRLGGPPCPRPRDPAGRAPRRSTPSELYRAAVATRSTSPRCWRWAVAPSRPGCATSCWPGGPAEWGGP